MTKTEKLARIEFLENEIFYLVEDIPRLRAEIHDFENQHDGNQILIGAWLLGTLVCQFI